MSTGTEVITDQGAIAKPSFSPINAFDASVSTLFVHRLIHEILIDYVWNY